MNRTRNGRDIILLIFVALFFVQCDTNYYEQYLPENQHPNVSNADVPPAQKIPVGAIPQDAYYIQLSTSDNYAAVQKVAAEYQNYGYTPLIFYTTDSKYIVVVEGGKNQFFAWNQQRKMRALNQLPPNSKIIKLQPNWTGPMFLDVPEGQNSDSNNPNPYVTLKPGAPTAPEIHNYTMDPKDETPGQNPPPPEPTVYDITNEKPQPKGADNEPTIPKQSIYDMVRGFFSPTSSVDTVQTAQLDRYYLLVGITDSLTAAKRVGEQYVIKGLPVFIWEKADGTYGIVIGEPDTEKNCEASRNELIDEGQISAGTIVPHSDEWLRVVFP